MKKLKQFVLFLFLPSLWFCNAAGIDPEADRKQCIEIVLAGAGAGTLDNNQVILYYFLCNIDRESSSRPPEALDTRPEEERE